MEIVKLIAKEKMLNIIKKRYSWQNFTHSHTVLHIKTYSSLSPFFLKNLSNSNLLRHWQISWQDRRLALEILDCKHSWTVGSRCLEEYNICNSWISLQ